LFNPDSIEPDRIDFPEAAVLGVDMQQFFFHVTTAYDILRHAGVDLAKKDFLGPPR
jgi:uncharacterized protein